MSVGLVVGIRTEDAGREGTRHLRGRLPKKPRLLWCLRNIRLKSMAYGNELQHLVEQLGVFSADATVLQDNGMSRWPVGASLRLSEIRQENVFKQCAIYLATQADCLYCPLGKQCLGWRAKGNNCTRNIYVVRRLLPSPASVEQKLVLLGSMW